jgi:protein-S-isoprenylcysteine O-methyltransferase Ste14
MDDNPFRIALVIYLGLLLPIGLYYRLRAHTGEALDRWQEGPLLLFSLRGVGFIGAISGLMWLIEPRWLAFAKLPLPSAVRWCGLALAIVAGALIAWTFHHLGRNLTDTVVTRKVHSLVTTGPYAYARHPFYASGAIAGLGCALITSNALLFVLVAVGFALLAARTRREERQLMERFGVDYKRYCRRVNAFLPRLGK